VRKEEKKGREREEPEARGGYDGALQQVYQLTCKGLVMATVGPPPRLSLLMAMVTALKTSPRLDHHHPAAGEGRLVHFAFSVCSDCCRIIPKTEIRNSNFCFLEDIRNICILQSRFLEL